MHTTVFPVRPALSGRWAGSQPRARLSRRRVAEPLPGIARLAYEVRVGEHLADTLTPVEREAVQVYWLDHPRDDDYGRCSGAQPSRRVCVAMPQAS